jgi:hypothetical protein
MGQRTEQSCFKEVQMSKKHMKKHSVSLAIKEMHIKTMLRFHLTPVRMLTQTTTNVNKDVVKNEP